MKEAPMTIYYMNPKSIPDHLVYHIKITYKLKGDPKIYEKKYKSEWEYRYDKNKPLIGTEWCFITRG